MQTPLTGIKKFIAATKVDEEIVQPTLAALQANNHNAMPVFSDMVKTENGKQYQYVNYVQEGGGMLGVALVGYTYVLEKLGIRFLKLAGTSAGAINTMMLAAVDKKNYTAIEKEIGEEFNTQSEIILFEMLNYNLWNLVDGSKFGKRLISTAINASNKLQLIIKTIVFCLLFALFSSLLLGVLALINTPANAWVNGVEAVLKFIAFWAVACVASLGMVAGVAFYYLNRFSKRSFGINPGKTFHVWMSDILSRNGIKTNADLDAKMAERFADVELRPERVAKQYPKDDNNIAPPFITIIASDITNQTKVEFPLMASEYYANPSQTNPADYVRASMSIPVFFEPFQLDVTQVLQQKNTKTQLKSFAENQRSTAQKIVQFVDGGILSNFPINVFHNPKIEWARMPTFGVKLEDEAHEKPAASKEATGAKPKRKLGPFLSSILSTIRFYYDRDFLKRNMVYESCIAHIDVAGFNWLDFGLDDATKKKLFIQGAKAAQTFFLGSTTEGVNKFWIDGKEMPFKAYDWETFKNQRREMVVGG